MIGLAPTIALCLAAGAASGSDPDAALSRPLSPGAVALLIEHARDPRTATRLGEALRDPLPGTRAAAARVANVAGIPALAPLLADVLAKETESEAALEELDALITLDPKADELALAAARRLGGNAPERLALTLAVVRGPAAQDHLEDLRALGLSVPTWQRFLELAGRRSPARVVPTVAAALHSRDVALWSAVLYCAERGWVQPGIADLAASLERDDGLRKASLPYLVLESTPAMRRTMPLAGALESLSEAGAPASAALELLARLEGRPAHDLTARLNPDKPEELALWQGVVRREDLRAKLDAREREALRAFFGLKKGAWPDPRPVPGTPKLDEDGRRSTALYWATGYPRGFVEDTLKLVGCAPDKGRDLGAVMRRGDDGRPREVTVLRDLAGSPACQSAAGVLAAGHLNRSSYDPGAGREEILLLPLDPGVLGCAAPSDPGPSPSVATDGELQPPRKTRNYEPHYPALARDNRIEGVVLLEALITHSGCVASLRVSRSAHPLLDLEALHTVSRWGFSPALRGGVPVPVTFTLPVSFVLHGAR